MRKLLLGLIVANLCLLGAGEAWAVKGYSLIDWKGEYDFSNGFQASPRPSLQPEVGLIFNSGFDAFLWLSLPASMRHIDQDQATEFDFCLGYSFWIIRIGISYYIMWPTSNLRNDIIQVNAQINGDEIKLGKFAINTRFRVEYNMPADGIINKNTSGLYLFPMVDFSYKATDKLTLSVNNKFAIDLGGYGADKAFVVRVTPDISYVFTEKWSVHAAVEILLPLIQSNGDPRRDHFNPVIGLKREF
jgi:hypothetical protein